MPFRPAVGFFFALLLLVSQLPLSSGTYETWAAAWFSEPERTAGLASPLADPDRDGCLNLAEYWAGTSPFNSSDCLAGEPAMNSAIPEVYFPHDATSIDTFGTFLVTDDLADWQEQGTPVRMSPSAGFQLNGYRFSKLQVHPSPGVFFDSDGDGLDDFFEEKLIASNTDDAFDSLADILPGDDFDSNGTPNLDEPGNAPATPAATKPALLDAATVFAALDGLPTDEPTALLVHTPLE